MKTKPDAIEHEICLLKLQMEELDNEPIEEIRVARQRGLHREINRLDRLHRGLSGEETYEQAVRHYYS